MLQSLRVTLLFTRICPSSITSAATLSPITGKSHVLLHPRSFSSSGQRYTTPLDEPPIWANLRETVRPSAMWLAPEGSKFDQQQVIDQLPKLQGKGEGLPTVLLLVTPKLAHLFENDHPFHSRLINALYGDSTEGALRQSIIAVVDALPVLGRFRGAGKPEMHGTEGIAMCVSPGFDVLPTKGSEGAQPLISMTSRQPYFDGQRHVTISWSGGVANTTFVNGRQHTLFMQNWSNRDGPIWMPEKKRRNLGRVDIPAYANQYGNDLSVVWNSKMIKLTDPKVIISSMGNIVRQVETSDGKELAASHELETIVPPMLKELQKSIPTGDLRVFALIYPPELGARDLFKDLVWGKEPKTTPVRLQRYNMNLLTMLAKGARLYRVTSGGAGWGKKAGLLSLEPIVELGRTAIEPEFPSFIFEEAQDIRMPGSADLFPPGYVIQFLGNFHDTEGSKKDAVSIHRANRIAIDPPSSLADWTDPEKAQQFCLGNTVLPETHQYTSLEDIDNSSARDDPSSDSTPQSLIFRFNRFGFLTSSALGLSARYHSPNRKAQSQIKFGSSMLAYSETHTGYKHSSLIELPNSYFLTKFAAGGKIVPEAAENSTGSRISKEPGNTIEPTILEHKLTEARSSAVASQSFRDEEAMQRDVSLVRRKRLVRTVGTRKGNLTRKVATELAHISKYESEPQNPVIVQHVPNTVQDVSSFLTARIKELQESRGLSQKHAHRIARYMRHRMRRLSKGRLTSFGVVSDATSRLSHKSDGSGKPVTGLSPNLPFRYSMSEPRESKLVGTPNHELSRSDNEHDLSAHAQASPNAPIPFQPFNEHEADSGLPVRRTISVPDKDRPDITSLWDESSIFRPNYGPDDMQESDEKEKAEKDRKRVEELTSDL